MAGSGVADANPDLTFLCRHPFDRDRRPDRRGIMNPSPQVSPVGHVAGLTGYSVVRVTAVLPLRVGVLEWLAVRRRSPGTELVTSGAEPGILEVAAPDDSAVRGALRRRLDRTIPARWPVPAVPPHVARAAHDSMVSQVRVIGRIRSPFSVARQSGALFRKGRVAYQAALHGAERRLLPVHELTRESRRIGSGVHRGLPVFVLRRVTDGAVLEAERGLEIGPDSGRRLPAEGPAAPNNRRGNPAGSRRRGRPAAAPGSKLRPPPSGDQLPGRRLHRILRRKRRTTPEPRP